MALHNIFLFQQYRHKPSMLIHLIYPTGIPSFKPSFATGIVEGFGRSNSPLAEKYRGFDSPQVLNWKPRGRHGVSFFWGGVVFFNQVKVVMQLLQLVCVIMLNIVDDGMGILVFMS